MGQLAQFEFREKITKVQGLVLRIREEGVRGTGRQEMVLLYYTPSASRLTGSRLMGMLMKLNGLFGFTAAADYQTTGEQSRTEQDQGAGFRG